MLLDEAAYLLDTAAERLGVLARLRSHVFTASWLSSGVLLWWAPWGGVDVLVLVAGFFGPAAVDVVLDRRWSRRTDHAMSPAAVQNPGLVGRLEAVRADTATAAGRLTHLTTVWQPPADELKRGAGELAADAAAVLATVNARLGVGFPRDVDTGLCRDLLQGNRCEGSLVPWARSSTVTRGDP